jgi:hypothetical protein
MIPGVLALPQAKEQPTVIFIKLSLDMPGHDRLALVRGSLVCLLTQ